MTVTELKALAKKKGVSLPIGAKKTDIIDVLMKRNGKEENDSAKKAAAKKSALPAKSAATKSPAQKKAKPPTVSIPSKAVGRPQLKQEQKETKKISPLREWTLPPRAEEPHMAQERIAGSKYYTGPQHAYGEGFHELPQRYGKDTITLMTRDPFIAYAYWEITPGRIEREKKLFGWDASLCVRIYDITGIDFNGRNALGYYDQDITEEVGSWYFDLGRPSHSFCAELGLRTPEGRFVTLARSNAIAMPRDTVSDVVDDQWMIIDEDLMKLYGIPSGLSSPQVHEMLKRRRLLEITSPGMFRSTPKRK